jgi:hypothetical protein
MTLRSFFSKINSDLSRTRPSRWRSSAHQGSSPKASSLVQRSLSKDKDLSSFNISASGGKEHQPLERSLSSGSDGATPLDDGLPSRAEFSSPFRRSCPENYLPHSDEPRKRSGRSLDGERHPPIDDALSSTTTRAGSHRSLGSSDPAPSRYAALEDALDLETFGGALARSERYKAVEGMLHFLDAQAEHRCA